MATQVNDADEKKDWNSGLVVVVLKE